jgi:hypothetical protein
MPASSAASFVLKNFHAIIASIPPGYRLKFAIIMGGVLATIFILNLLSQRFFLRRSLHEPLPGIIREWKKGLREREEKGLLVSTAFKVRRAFALEPFEDDEPCYFLELANGTVLYLQGDYLNDYGLKEGDPNVNYGLLFPCSDFTVRRQRENGGVCDIQCHGKVVAPEITFPPFQPSDTTNGLVPKDGDIIRDRSYDQIKARIQERKLQRR